MTAVVAKRVVLCTLSGNAQVHVHYMTVPEEKAVEEAII